MEKIIVDSKRILDEQFGKEVIAIHKLLEQEINYTDDNGNRVKPSFISVDKNNNIVMAYDGNTYNEDNDYPASDTEPMFSIVFCHNGSIAIEDAMNIDSCSITITKILFMGWQHILSARENGWEIDASLRGRAR